LHGDQVIDMPLLFESGAYMLTWPRMLVKCDPELQVRGSYLLLVKSGMHACRWHALDFRCSKQFVPEVWKLQLAPSGEAAGGKGWLQPRPCAVKGCCSDAGRYQAKEVSIHHWQFWHAA
jgi:hypothetical protein